MRNTNSIISSCNHPTRFVGCPENDVIDGARRCWVGLLGNVGIDVGIDLFDRFNENQLIVLP